MELNFKFISYLSSSRLLSSNSTFLTLLGKEFKFEIAIGCNGLIWLKANNTKEAIFLVNTIQKYTNTRDVDVDEFIKNSIKNDLDNFGNS